MNPQRPEPQSGALPLNYTHHNFILSIIRNRTSNGTPEGIRTPDPQLRRLLLYPTELLALKRILVAAQGFEPRTCGL